MKKFVVLVQIEVQDLANHQFETIGEPYPVAYLGDLKTAELVVARLRHEAITAKRAILGPDKVCHSCGGDLSRIGDRLICENDCGNGGAK